VGVRNLGIVFRFFNRNKIETLKQFEEEAHFPLVDGNFHGRYVLKNTDLCRMSTIQFPLLATASLPIGLIIFTLAAITFRIHQNAPGTLGGPISRPKTFWLFWALFYYYFLSTWIYLALPPAQLTICLALFILTICGRAIVQPILLYLTKSWTPYYGISFNLMLALGLSIGLIHFYGYSSVQSAIDWIHCTYLMGAALALITDSYYAYRFHQMVGDATKGNQAIWYASHRDARFNEINKLTAYGNMLFSVLLLLVLLQIILL
jgi:hypothetical protein